MKVPNLFKNPSKNFIGIISISYIAIISLLLVVIAIIVGVYQRFARSENYSFNNYVFNNVLTSVNEVLSEMNSLKFNLTNNERLFDLLKTDEKHNYYSEDTYKIIEDFKAYNRFHLYVDTSCVYIKASDVVLHSGGIIDSRVFFNIWFNTGEFSYEEWKNLVANTQSEKYLSLNGNGIDDEKTEYLALMFPVTENENGVGMILSDKRYLIKNMENSKPWKNFCDIYIYNPYRRLVAYRTAGSNLELPETVPEIMLYDNEHNTIFSGNIFLDSNTWQVFAVIKNKALNSELVTIQTIVAIVLLCSLIMLVFVVVYLVKINYSPLKRILSMLGIDKSKYELNYIYDSINDILKRNDYLLHDMGEKEELLGKVAMSYVLKGELAYSSLDKYKLAFPGDCFILVSFYIPDITEFFKNTKMATDEKYRNLNYIIENVIGEMLNYLNLQNRFIGTDLLYVCLVNSNEIGYLNKVRKVACDGLEFINKNFKINLTCAISDVCEGTNNLQAAYEQTVEILKHKRFFGIKDILEYSEISKPAQDGYVFNRYIEQGLVKNISSGNKELALSMLNRIFDNFDNAEHFSMSYIKYVSLDVTSAIIKAKSNEVEDIEKFTEKSEFYENILKSDSVTALRNLLIEYTINTCEHIKKTCSKTDNGINIDNVVNYLRNNFTDSNLNLSFTAAHFNVNADSLSRAFRTKMGISFLDYLNGLRVARVKEIVQQKGCSIWEAAALSGFNSERTFYRVMKKLSL